MDHYHHKNLTGILGEDEKNGHTSDVNMRQRREIRVLVEICRFHQSYF